MANLGSTKHGPKIKFAEITTGDGRYFKIKNPTGPLGPLRIRIYKWRRRHDGEEFR